MIIVIPVKGGEYITGFRGCSLPPQIEDCGRINGLVLLSQHPPMGVFEKINNLGLLPRFPQIEVAGNINGLGQSANLHSGTIPTSYRQLSVLFFYSKRLLYLRGYNDDMTSGDNNGSYSIKITLQTFER